MQIHRSNSFPSLVEIRNTRPERRPPERRPRSNSLGSLVQRALITDPDLVRHHQNRVLGNKSQENPGLDNVEYAILLRQVREIKREEVNPTKTGEKVYPGEPQDPNKRPILAEFTHTKLRRSGFQLAGGAVSVLTLIVNFGLFLWCKFESEAENERIGLIEPQQDLRVNLWWNFAYHFFLYNVTAPQFLFIAETLANAGLFTQSSKKDNRGWVAKIKHFFKKIIKGKQS